MMPGTHQETEKLLRDWLRRFNNLQHAHYDVARNHRRRNYLLGVPVALLTAFVGASIFAMLEANVSTGVQVAVGLISFSAAALAAVQTFLGYAESAEKNRIAAARYGSLRHVIEQELALPTRDEAELRKLVTSIREQSDRYALESPEIPARVYAKWKGKETARALSGAPGPGLSSGEPRA